MRFDTVQHMKLGQQMKLAPRMIQSMEILQMPLMALQERIDQELESNIALEQLEPGMDEEQLDSERKEEEREDRMGERELVVGDDTPDGAEDFERLSIMESSYKEAFDNEYGSSRFGAATPTGERDKKMDAMANVAARGESLTEQLQHQWTFAEVEPDHAQIGSLLIEYINDDGLLSADFETIIDQNHNIPGITPTLELLGQTLAELQKWLDPPGIAARDLRESFLNQVDHIELEDEEEHDWDVVRQLIQDHYDDLLENRLPKIAQDSGLSMQHIHDAMGLMHRLKLHPGRDLVPDDVPPIIPDVIVEYDEPSDEYVAGLSHGLLPMLRISKQYEQMAKDKAVDKQTREFVGNNVRNAQWLIESIGQRNNTLLRVVNVVLTRQREYFDHGPQHLKPLPMVDVADQLGIHVGTVSRAVADKWMQTPRGLVALRKFFSGGTETESGESMSWDAVKARLREIVEGEDKFKPLSDEAIAQALKSLGIDIARRTVVKYRQQLDIPPARRRRQYKD
ncbi:MAG: RNA polymerase factor sigma-54 [Planctomycetota bacterium]|nr:RNA polymerase factor sigma-54 [Planctomycetota bacterium]